MRKILILGLLSVVLLSACAAPATDQELTEESQSPEVTVYRSPT
jgi:uncharacterized lipoprotein YajG